MPVKRILASAALVALSAIAFRCATPCDSVPGRRPLQIAVSSVGAVAINAGVTDLLKHSIHELRPDRSDNSSFPSRHSSWAFAASTMLSNELYAYSPWWSVCAQAAASAIAYQRVAARKHYASDVIAGAAIGIASTELGYWLGRKITGGQSVWHSDCAVAEFDPNISLSSRAVYNLSSDFCTAFATAAELRFPLAEYWGVVSSLEAMATPVKTSAEGVRPLNTLSLQFGGAGHFILPRRSLAIEPLLAVGIACNTGRRLGLARYGFCSSAGAGVQWRLTPRFGVRADAVWKLFFASGSHNAISLQIASVAFF